MLLFSEREFSAIDTEYLISKKIVGLKNSRPNISTDFFFTDKGIFILIPHSIPQRNLNIYLIAQKIIFFNSSKSCSLTYCILSLVETLVDRNFSNFANFLDLHESSYPRNRTFEVTCEY